MEGLVLFNSAPFAILLCIVLLVYWSTRSQAVRLTALLLGSMVFYAWRHWPSIFLLLGTIGFNYAMGRVLGRKEGKKRTLLALGVGVNLLSLLWFKYSAFVAKGLQSLLGELPLPEPSHFLPLGI